MAALCPVCQVFPTVSQRRSGSMRGPISKAPPGHNPSLATCQLRESKQNACFVWRHACSRYWGQRAAWRNQKSEKKPRGPSHDNRELLGPSCHFFSFLLLNRITSYSQEVLIEQDLPSTICGQFQGLVASGLCCLGGQDTSGLCVI